ncbi:nucleotidyl transferase AbiEii/AbiGii toxin family protein [Acetivibrio ethanolgignens]|uniref:Nucleotidyltransferase n=1 Tax=Acetivibrio ethanolgignens TaxID=290052 RepID=A0A0V8QBG8_9FIRM|nr:nucleotidyl transferase AbiEii/AbiGii toxin family protein [Acetivibrio ethanolgignens]KSV57904.1 hypothetical protein ASU35_14930 [Acetivibrio ethanolgignens]
MEPLNAFDDVKTFETDVIDIYESENSKYSKLADLSHMEQLDYMVNRLASMFTTSIAFKGGYMLNKLIPGSRMTFDIDFSIEEKKNYEVIKNELGRIAIEFEKAGIIADYKIKDSIAPTSSGGIDMYAASGEKILGVDVGLHNISYGVKHYNIKFTEVQAFEFERMLSDKIIAILSRKRFRRAKDLYDLYAITNYTSIDFKKLVEYIEIRGGAEWDHIPFSDDVIVQYRKAWEKLVLIDSTVANVALDKPEFDDVLFQFYRFIMPVKNKLDCTKWSPLERRWK